MVKKLAFGLIGLAVGLVSFAGFMVGRFAMEVERIDAQPAKGFYADYFLYVSPGARHVMRDGRQGTILVQPNNSGINSDDPSVHRKDAWWMSFGRHFLARDLGVILIVPAFVRPADDWHIYSHALDRDVLTTDRTDLARLDLQLIAMIDDARQRLQAQNLVVNDKVLIQGYSASGMFANRFAAIHPQRVMGVAAGSPGGWPIAPIGTYQGEALPYPAGIYDLHVLTGHPFDSISYSAVPQILVLGSLDDNDSLDYTDGWDKESADLVDRLFGSDPIARWPHAQSIYSSAGSSSTFLLIDNVGHDRKALQEYSTRFFRALLDAN